MRQMLCVWFPNWPIQSIIAAQPAPRRAELKRQAVVLHTALDSRKPQVTACSPQASRRGIQPGMPLAEARMLAPTACFLPADHTVALQQLRRLAWTCQRFTPRVALETADQPECLALDVSGCIQHFGTLPQLRQQLTNQFQIRGYQTQIAAAATFGAAWALAHASRPSTHQPSQPDHTTTDEPATTLADQLAPLPIACLRLTPATLESLTECGIATISQLLAIPRSSLPSRFGDGLLKRVDQALGRIDEPLTPESPPEPIESNSQFESPLQSQQMVESCLQHLLNDVTEKLQKQQRETQRLRIRWKAENGQTGQSVLRLLRPTASATKLTNLLDLHVQRQPLANGIIQLQIRAFPCRSESAQQTFLLDTESTQQQKLRDHAFDDLIEQLSNRLGEQAVVRYRLVAESQPELAIHCEPWLMQSPNRPANSHCHASAATAPRVIRPLRLLTMPIQIAAEFNVATTRLERFHWQGQERLIRLCHGPERIETGWWRSVMIRRDYYRVETNQGTRFWLFQDLKQRDWYLHGIYA